MNQSHSPLVQGILKDSIKHRLTVRQLFSKYEMSMYGNEHEIALEHLKNRIVKDISNYIIPKLELKTERDSFEGAVAMRGQLYVFSQSEFEDLLDGIEATILKSLEPKFKWGNDDFT